MSELVSKPTPGAARMGGMLAGLLCAGVALGPALGAEAVPVPDFAPSSAAGWLVEMACAENNEDHFHHGLDPMPQADRPDF